MSPAGAGSADYRGLRLGPHTAVAVLLVALAGPFVLLGGGNQTARASQPSVAAFSRAWAEFQRDCVHGPSPGQGSSPASCRCWEAHLQAVHIRPADAVDLLAAAQAGGGAGSAVAQNLVDSPIGEAIAGCLLS